ncbi:hypothetical protein CEXT_602481 [Caerostris extrusa]|uniref:Uncharacterized protein n=1 Tax=Caerostris extrusa TaxID=172846 RepID=A0AAV4WG35_CAEEX|nr:hypothetical protein CEXT_602481 [Caerostris extrusa]
MMADSHITLNGVRMRDSRCEKNYHHYLNQNRTCWRHCNLDRTAWTVSSRKKFTPSFHLPQPKGFINSHIPGMDTRTIEFRIKSFSGGVQCAVLYINLDGCYRSFIKSFLQKLY